MIRMPTVFEIGGLKIVIRTHDHAPPHVHVIGPGAECIIEINSLEVRFSRGFKASAVRELQGFVEARREKLMEKWNEIHGEEQE